MNIWIFIVVTVILSVISFHYSKDLLEPGFLFGIFWVVFAVLLTTSDLNYDPSSEAYLYLALGSVFFHVGCYFGKKSCIKGDRLFGTPKSTYVVNYVTIKMILVVQMLFTFFVLNSYYNFINNHYFKNVFLSFYSNRNNYVYYDFVAYGRNILLATGLCIILGYMFIEKNEKQRYLKYIVIEVVIYLLNTATKLTRNGILQSLLPLFFMYLIISKQNNKEVLRKMILVFTAFMVFFALVSFWKYYYLFSKGHFIKTILKQIYLYGSGSFVAFQKTYDRGGFPHLDGQNTFRFIYAVYDRLLDTHMAVPLEQKFTSIGGANSNVYTFYYYYISDYGPIYALIIQLILGFVHGIQYRKMSKLIIHYVYLYCVSVYPLIMQFFQDQYVSLLSTWIQLWIVGFFFLRTNVLFFCKSDEKGCLVIKK